MCACVLQRHHVNIDYYLDSIGPLTEYDNTCTNSTIVVLQHPTIPKAIIYDFY